MRTLRVAGRLCILLVLRNGGVSAQENVTSPPPPLPWPQVETDTTIPTTFGVQALRRAVELGANTELCRKMMGEQGLEVPSSLNWETCPAAIKQTINDRRGAVHWEDGAKPTECGEGCVGRPFLSQTTHLDRPNAVYAKLYGHIDLGIDTVVERVVPVDRTLRLGYEAQFYCNVDPRTRAGNLAIRVEFGPPALSGSGVIESILDFVALPLAISSRIEAGIREGFATPSPSETSYSPCVSVGVWRNDDAAYDQILFRAPSARPRLDVMADARVGTTARVRFLAVKRNSPNPRYSPPIDPGAFVVYLNGEPVYFPDAPALRDLVPGATASINFCRAIDVSAADRLQILFTNSHGGGVWSQFTAAQRLGAGGARRMTTGRTVVVAGLPRPNRPARPETLVLREYELLYQVDYVPAPTEVVSEPMDTRAGDGRNVGELGDRVRDRAAELFGTTDECRAI